jgi:hypothetical protein
MGREYTVLSHLAGHYDKAPRPILPTARTSRCIGAPFYLMERLRGVILRRELPPGLAIDEHPGPRPCPRSWSTPWPSSTTSTTRPSAWATSASRPATSSARSGLDPPLRRAPHRRHPGGRRGRRLAGRAPAGRRPPALIHNDFKFDNTGPRSARNLVSNTKFRESRKSGTEKNTKFPSKKPGPQGGPPVWCVTSDLWIVSPHSAFSAPFFCPPARDVGRFVHASTCGAFPARSPTSAGICSCD